MDDDNFEDSLLSTVKLRFYENGSMKSGKDIMVSRTATFEEILHLVGHKLGIRAKRLFTSEGMEIDDTSLLDNGDIIFVSSGNGYVIPSSSGSETFSSTAKHRRHNHEHSNHPLSPLDSGSSTNHSNFSSSHNEIIGNYRTIKLLGRGGFGEVRLAVHSITHEYAAIKFLPLGEAMSATDAERVTTEISCLSELDHIHVIKLLQVINTNNYVAIILEYAPGGELKQYVDTIGRKRLLSSVQQYLQQNNAVSSPSASVSSPSAASHNIPQSILSLLLASPAILGVPKSDIDFLYNYTHTMHTETALPLSVAISNLLSPPSTIASISPYLHFKPTHSTVTHGHDDPANTNTRSYHRQKFTESSLSSDSASPTASNSTPTHHSNTSHNTPGGLLEEVWNSGLDEEEACIKFLQIARGVAYAHSKRIIHRDLKLENVLIGTQNNLKIADFGLSQYSSNNDNSNTGASGSLYYMAPETLLPKPPSPSASLDIWSLGVVLYTLLTGRLPFVSLSVLKAEHQLRLEALMQYIIMPMVNSSTDSSSNNQDPLHSPLPSDTVHSAFKKPPKSTPLTNNASTNNNRPQRRSISHVSDNHPTSNPGSTVCFTNENTNNHHHRTNPHSSSRPESASSQTNKPHSTDEPHPAVDNNGLSMHDVIGISRPESASVSDEETWDNFSPKHASSNHSNPVPSSSSADTLISKAVLSETVTVNPSNDSILSSSSSGGALSSPTNPSSSTIPNHTTPPTYLNYFQRDYFMDAEKTVETVTILKETRNAITNAKFFVPKRLSPQVIHLLKSMLNPDPVQRPSVSEILVHPWLLTNSSSRITGMLTLDSVGSLNDTGEENATTPDIDTPGVISPSNYGNGLKSSSSSSSLDSQSNSSGEISNPSKGITSPGGSNTTITNTHTVGSRIMISPLNKMNNTLSSTAPKLVINGTKDTHSANTPSVYETYRDDTHKPGTLGNTNVHLAGSGASALLQKSRSSRNRVNIGALGSPSTITSPISSASSIPSTGSNNTTISLSNNSTSVNITSPHGFTSNKPPLFSSPTQSLSSRSLTSPSHGMNTLRPSINIGTVITSPSNASDSSAYPTMDSTESPLPPLRALMHIPNETHAHTGDTDKDTNHHPHHPPVQSNLYGAYPSSSSSGTRSKRTSLVESTFTIGSVVPAREENTTGTNTTAVHHSSPVETVAAAQALLSATGIDDDDGGGNDNGIRPDVNHPSSSFSSSSFPSSHTHDTGGIHIASHASFMASLMPIPSSTMNSSSANTAKQNTGVSPIHIPGTSSRPRTPVHLQPLDIGSIIQPSSSSSSHHQR